MRRRTLALTSASAVVAAMTVLPSISASAAEPLLDGAYAFDVAGSTINVTVTEGQPTVTDLPDGWVVEFTRDEQGGLLNELVVTTLDGELSTVNDVTIDLQDDDGDGTVDGYSTTVVERVAEEEPVAEEPTGEQGDGTGEATDGGDGTQTPVEEDQGTEEPVVEDDDGVEELDEESSHGAIVSTVAECAPRGREARDAGLPNHGYFVSAAARGESVSWTVVDGTGGETVVEADLATLDGATAFCAAVTSDAGADTDPEVDTDTGTEPDADQDVATDAEPEVGALDDTVDADDSVESDDSVEEDDQDERRGPPEGRGRDNGRGGPPQGVPGRGPRG